MRSPLIVLVAAIPLLFVCPASRAGILINEVNIDPPGNDEAGNLEYIELISTSGGVESTTGMTLLLIDSENSGYGRIRKRWSLNGLATGANGLLVLGNNYPGTPTLAFPYGDLPAGTTYGDPGYFDAFNNGDVGSNGGMTLFLVAGFNPNVPLDTDLDENDNGHFDFIVWTIVLDSVGFDDANPLDPPHRQTYALADVSHVAYFPENISRTAGDLRPNNAGAWFGGIFSSSANARQFDLTRTFNGFPGARISPGESNAPPPIADLRINEVSIDPNGSDENLEFVELLSVLGNVQSADAYHLVILANDPDASEDPGTIVEAWDLSGLKTGTNGLLLLGDGYSKPFAEKRADTPFKNLVEVETEAGDPPSMGRNEIKPHNGISILLVTGYSGTPGMDLDTENHGVLDVTPWAAIVDSVGFDNPNDDGTPTYAEGRLLISDSVPFPGNISRTAGILAANNADAWYGGRYGGVSQASISFGTNYFQPTDVIFDKRRATPGQRNLAPVAPGDPPYQRDILLNEIRLDLLTDPGGDDAAPHGFIEIISANGRAEVLDGLDIVLVDTNPDSVQFGLVVQRYLLSGLSTGPNGLCVLQEKYETVPRDVPVPFDTNGEDPGVNANELGLRNGLTVLLVEGFTGVVGISKLDENGDGVFDLDPPLWDNLLDGVGFGRIAESGVANVSQAGFKPNTMARLPGSLHAAARSERGAWCGGVLDAEPGQTRYGTSYFGPFRGGVTAGFGNHAATPAEDGGVLLNEVVVRPAAEGAGDRAECVEILSTSLESRSLSGYTLVLLDSRGSSVGNIRHLWDLSGLATGSNGLLLVGEDFGDFVPFAIDEETAHGTVLGMKSGDIADDDALSLLLVKGLLPSVVETELVGEDLEKRRIAVNEGIDLDVGLTPFRKEDIDPADNDGILDRLPLPWSAIVDSVGFREYDPVLSANTGITYAAADLTRNFAPDAVARLAVPLHLNGNTSADWYGGDFSGTSSDSFAFVPTGTFGIMVPAAATPGFHNLGGVLFDSETRDLDKDGRIRILELATGTDPFHPDAPVPVSAARVTEGGLSYLSVTYPRLPGGILLPSGQYLAAGILYTVEISGDLGLWTIPDLVAVESTLSENGLPVELATLRSAAPLDDTTGTQYVRLRVTRESSE